jgi:hypothetical protein
MELHVLVFRSQKHTHVQHIPIPKSPLGLPMSRFLFSKQLSSRHMLHSGYSFEPIDEIVYVSEKYLWIQCMCFLFLPAKLATQKKIEAPLTYERKREDCKGNTCGKMGTRDIRKSFRDVALLGSQTFRNLTQNNRMDCKCVSFVLSSVRYFARYI